MIRCYRFIINCAAAGTECGGRGAVTTGPLELQTKVRKEFTIAEKAPTPTLS